MVGDLNRMRSDMNAIGKPFFPCASLKSAKTLEVVACFKLLHENRPPLRPPLVIFTEADY